MKVSRMMVWKVEQNYKRFGEDSFTTKKVGRPFVPLNNKYKQIIVNLWNENKCGARKLHVISKKKGYGVSKNKISQVMKENGLQKPFPKRQKPRKYKRYEWPISNYMWHCDWHMIKSKRMYGTNILVFIDDSSRKIMSYILGGATARNSILALYSAVAEHKVTPFSITSDRGAHFIASKFDKKGNANHQFQIVLKELSILFIPSKVRHPQTNGKNERFFGILDSEFDERFETIDDFIKWYNGKRLSEAINYSTPNETYKKRL